MHALTATLALILERFFGYPEALAERISHPVVWIGGLIDMLDRRLNRADLPASARRQRGVAALVLLLLAVGIPALIVGAILRAVPGGWIIEAILATALLAQKELRRAVREVADALGVSLDEGRRAVSAIVGRDPETLDQAGVSRAAIESLAESTSDGVIAPLFWLLILGLPGIALYKALNTADSMIGHKTEQYLNFGWASARFDDLVNWIPARLTGLLIVAAAPLVRGNGRAAWDTMLSDAKKHDSPNAGWPEAAMAGALGFALGGPRAYDGEMLDLPQFGGGRADLGPDDIRRSLKLYGVVLNITLGICLAMAIPALR